MLTNPDIEENITKNSPIEIAFFISNPINPTKIGVKKTAPPTPVLTAKAPMKSPKKNRSDFELISFLAFPFLSFSWEKKNFKIDTKSTNDRKISKAISLTFDTINPLKIAPTNPPKLTKIPSFILSFPAL